MKVSTQPLSAFAVYSEKLKQKKKSKPLVSNRINKKRKPQVSNGIKKKSKPNTTNGVKKKSKPEVSNGINKLKKVQRLNDLNKPKNDVDKKTLKMKEIGYILRKLAEQSADTSSPRATALLDSISEANERLEHEHGADSIFLEDTLRNVIEIENLKKKARHLKDLNKKKVSKPVSKTVLSSGDFRTSDSKLAKLSTSENLADCEETTRPAESSTNTFLSSCDKPLDARKSKGSKLKKKKATYNEEANSLNLRADHTRKNKFKLSPAEALKRRKTSEQHEVILKKRDKEKVQRKHNLDSDSTAKQLFEWIILPVSEKYFMSDFWEKQPLLIQRDGNRNYFSELLSTERLDVMLRENNVCFTKHLDITSYRDGVRETHNVEGRAQASVVWDFYSNGCSVRMLNPQIFLPKIHALNATLQEYFGCFVGANVYLTPPNSQGFAPHYDDIEAFVLQIEGKKHWKVYTPRTDTEVLPRLSSPNFSQEEIGDPFLDVTLEPGDLLYFPRGFIHQASTVEGEHSLHITLSVYQKTSWVDLLEKVLPIALKRAAQDDVEFRRGLPRDYLGLEYRGSAKEKQSFVDTAQDLMTKLGRYVQLSLGAGVDEMGAQFMHDALPPVFTPIEKQNSSVERGLKLKNGKLEGRVEFQMDTCIKLIRYNICRLVEQENEVRLYHCLDNPLEYHGDEPQFLVLPLGGVEVITQLQTRYPAFITIREIPHKDQEALIALVSDLWETGLLSAEDLPIVEES